MSLTLYGIGLSPYVRKVRALLAEKNEAYEHDPLIPAREPERARSLHPLGKIPVLRDGDFTLADSSAICGYLERRFPKPALYPQDARQYGRALWLEELADTALFEVIGGKIFVPLVVLPLLMGSAPDEAGARAAFERDLPPHLDYLERELGDAAFLVGDRLSIADISIASCFANLFLTPFAPDAARWPQLCAYLARIHARPSFKALLEQDRAALGGERKS